MVTLWSYNSGVPNLQAMDWSSRRWVAGKRAELHLYLQPLSIACISPQFMEKLSSMKPIPDAKKVGDQCYNSLTQCCQQVKLSL